jgi:regulatory protein
MVRELREEPSQALGSSLFSDSSFSEEESRALAHRIALDRLARRSHSCGELRAAFAKRAIPIEIGEELIVALTRSNLLDDGEFARAWRDSRMRTRGLAPRVIARELREKGIDADLILEVIGEVSSESEEMALQELLAKKVRSLRPGDRKKQERALLGFLLRKGHRGDRSGQAVRDALNSFYSDN